MKTIIRRLRMVILGVSIFTLVNIAVADQLPLRYNIGATVALVAIIGLWKRATRPRHSHAYEPFNR